MQRQIRGKSKSGGRTDYVPASISKVLAQPKSPSKQAKKGSIAQMSKLKLDLDSKPIKEVQEENAKKGIVSLKVERVATNTDVRCNTAVGFNKAGLYNFDQTPIDTDRSNIEDRDSDVTKSRGMNKYATATASPGRIYSPVHTDGERLVNLKSVSKQPSNLGKSKKSIGKMQTVLSARKSLNGFNTLRNKQVNTDGNIPANNNKFESNPSSIEKRKSAALLRNTTMSPTQKRHSAFPFSSGENILSLNNAGNNQPRNSIMKKKGNELERTIQFKVAARFRPLNDIEKEISPDSNQNNKTCIEYLNGKTIKVHNNNMGSSTEVTLDAIFPPTTEQHEIFDRIAKETIDEVTQGYNGTIFAYGQSGSGKTFTMFGKDIYDTGTRGIIPRSIDHIFDYINKESIENENTKFEIKFSLVELYKEQIYDLLNPDTKPTELKIKEHPQKGVFIHNLTEEYITTSEEFLMLLEEAEGYRAVSQTLLNMSSSRSHLIFILEISQKNLDEVEKKGILNLIDLAGSEKVSKTGATGETLEEAKKINLSLSSLGIVINALNNGSKDEFVPYRDSKLTRILQDSLCGNFRTTLIVTCSPHPIHLEETLSTLNFGQRARTLKNNVRANIKRPNEDLEFQVTQLKKELTQAKEEIFRMKTMSNFNKTRNKESSRGSKLNNFKSGLGGENKELSSAFNTHEVLTPSNEREDIDEVAKKHERNEKSSFDNNNSNLAPETRKLLNTKEEEISNLKKEVEKLKKSNEELTIRVNVLLSESKLERYLKELEEIVKMNITELDRVKKEHESGINSLLSEENVKLRKQLDNMQEKFLSECQKYENFNSLSYTDDVFNFEYHRKNFEKKLAMFTKKVEEASEVSSVNSAHGGENFNKNDSKGFYYKSVISESRFFLRKIVDDFLTKGDYFQTAKNSFVANTGNNLTNMNSENDINVSVSNNNVSVSKSGRYKMDFYNDKYVKLKNGFVQLCFINSYYEKIVFDVLNRAVLEMKRSEVEINWKMEYFSKIDKFMEILNNYLEVLEEVKKLKHTGLGDTNSNINPRHHSKNVSRKVSKKSSKFLASIRSNLNPSFIINAVNEKCNMNITPKKFSESITEEVKQKYSRSIVSDMQVLNKDSIKNITQDRYGKFEDPDNKGVLISSNNLINRRNHSIFDSVVNNANEHTTSVIMKNEISEFRLVKQELNFHKSFVDYLKSDIKTLKEKNMDVEKSIQDYLQKYKKIYENQIDNYSSSIKIMTSFYEDEMIKRREIIENLCKTIDDMFLNKSAVEDKLKRQIFEDYYKNLKKNILSQEDPVKSSIYKVADSYLSETGSATRKMDYIVFHLNDMQSMSNMKVDFGSGLNSNFPGKCPLNRNLRIPLVGDGNDSILNCDNDDK